MKQNIVLLRSCVLLLNGIFLVGGGESPIPQRLPWFFDPKENGCLG